MLPGPVLVMLRILAWLLAPHLALATASSFIFDDRGVFICCTLAITSVICALQLHTHDRVDARITQGFDVHGQNEAQLARLAASVLDSGQVAVTPIPQPAAAPDLRLVQDGASSR